MRFIGAFALLAMVATACGDDAAGGCVEVREPEDPLSIQHVIDPDAVDFDQPHPSSGPHLSGPAATGVLGEPLLLRGKSEWTRRLLADWWSFYSDDFGGEEAERLDAADSR